MRKLSPSFEVCPLWGANRLTNDLVLWTELIKQWKLSSAEVSVCRLAPTPENFLWHTWWHFSTQFFAQFLAVMGFTATETSTHEQYHRGKAHTLFTIVARRE
jgi:hypothetical protein